MPITRSWWGLAGASAAAVLNACAPRTPAAPAPATDRSLEYRVTAPGSAAVLTFDSLAGALAPADVVVFGEQHDDPATHRAQLALLEALGRRKAGIVLSLEMFERDAQRVLDDYLAGRMSEQDFVARSRPWPRYPTDYRPLVELAKARGWPVVAANVPRSLASAIGRRGLAALDTLTPEQRAHAAADISCPNDAYRTRFLQQMRSHGSGAAGSSAPGDSLPTAMAER
ncbi:MAG TPA: ChaN family lipoprotein, partial [Gemmatimonadaceae bacterium]|nr:ChaN family lipoprotein [Gemmatimonadaceae bacterium]